MGGTLTIGRLHEAYDRPYRFPHEPHVYFCHPDDLDHLRGVHNPERWGTCPMIYAIDAVAPGKVVQVANKVDPKWLWPWQR